MNPFLSDKPLFDFTYGGKKMQDCDYTVSRTEKDDTATMTYRFPNGLQITNIVTKYDDFGAYEWVNWLENTSDKPTDVITDLWDCSCSVPMEHEDPTEWVALRPEFEKTTRIIAPLGDHCSPGSFSLRNLRPQFDPERDFRIALGESREFHNAGGRSSDGEDSRCAAPCGYAPFFNVYKGGRGFIAAVGWTGQWKCSITRGAEDVIFRSKVEDTEFYLLPGEKFRTSSVVLMPYEGLSVVESQNKWRRLVKTHFSLIGKKGRDQYGPLSMQIWGGVPTDLILKSIKTVKEYQIPYDYAWVDAGWYGMGSVPSPDDFEGDWPLHTGDWRVNPNWHPNGLRVISDAAADAGMKFLLWFEPERAFYSTPIVSEHPEYFIGPPNGGDHNRLLNLGNPDAWQYLYTLLCDCIEEMNISCYRQDFNMPPIEFWRNNDTGDRRGITEIKHISGMYRLWDSLLERFPHLIIDNCSSGGRRIDIETLRRSIPLWRSDFACPANTLPEGIQMQQLSYHPWLPYAGTGCGQLVDPYRVRSAYTSAMAESFFLNVNGMERSDAELKQIKKFSEEYLQVRPYFSEDFYPLTTASSATDVWSAAQFDSPEMQSGLIQVFRREHSPYLTAVFQLGGIREDCVYRFRDIDTDEEFTLTGAELKKDGLSLTIPEQRTAKLYLYSYEN